jgi:hypothetical protein
MVLDPTGVVPRRRWRDILHNVDHEKISSGKPITRLISSLEQMLVAKLFIGAWFAPWGAELKHGKGKSLILSYWLVIMD